MLNDVYMKDKAYNTFNHYSPIFIAFDVVEFIRSRAMYHF